MTGNSESVVVVGAGPYGLAAAAHLRGAGIPARVFGDSMSFWERSMPAGMLLRSPWDGSHISDPNRAHTLDVFEREGGMRRNGPIPLESFVRYGQWFQNRVVPDLDCRGVTQVESTPSGFQLTLSDGETVAADRVVIAGGIAPFARRPAPFTA